MRLWKKLLLSAGVFLTCALTGRAQFIGYVSPQTVQQTLATSVACAGINTPQIFNVANLGQTQHYASIIFAPGFAGQAVMEIDGVDTGAHMIRLSDQLTTPVQNTVGAIYGSGYFPIIQVKVSCVGGSFTLSYSGSSATANLTAGGYQTGQIDKGILNNGAANSNASLIVQTPFGGSTGTISALYSVGSAGGSITVSCANNFFTPLLFTFSLANTTSLQTFPVSGVPCPLATVAYVNGGAAGTISIDYVFVPPGAPPPASTLTGSIAASQNANGGVLSVAPSNWSVISNPAAGSQATASKAAGATGVRHVGNCISFSAADTAAPAATLLTVNLRDGASGAGTILWTAEVFIPATAGAQAAAPFEECGLNAIGSSATAMTLEFSAGLANLIEAVSIQGYDVGP
jgi:hypothetical protein